MEITGEYKLKGTRQEVWDVLDDAKKLERAIPGIDRLIGEGPDRYRAEMSVGIGVIRGKFSGAMQVEDKVEPESYRMLVDGKCGAGWIKGDGNLKLSEAGEGATVVKVDGEASVGGLMARVGQRMVGNVANALMKQFFQNVDKELARARK